MTLQPKSVTYRTGSVYIDPPAMVTGPRGGFEVVGGNSQIVSPFTRVLAPGESVRIGSPNYQLLPRTPAVSAAMSVYPALLAKPGRYTIRQPIAVEVDGRAVSLITGILPLEIAPSRTPIAWGPVIGGFQSGIGVQRDQSRYRIGDTVGLYLYLRNAGSVAANITYRTNGEPVMVECTTSNGQRASLSHTMISTLPYPRSVTLKPGEAVIISSPEVELAGAQKPGSFQRDVLVAEPGRYLFHADRISNYQEEESVPGRGAIPSGKLTIEIVRS